MLDIAESSYAIAVKLRTFLEHKIHINRLLYVTIPLGTKHRVLSNISILNDAVLQDN